MDKAGFKIQDLTSKVTADAASALMLCAGRTSARSG